MLINGHTFAGMLVSAANALDNNKTVVNNMNIFPVPDGDTGTNMTLTMSTVREFKDFEGTISDCADRMAKMMLRSARGNSGAILSLFFRGMSKSLQGLEMADSVDIANAFKRGTEEAYKAVMNPTEGTILTVMRVCTEQAAHVAKKKYQGDVVGFFTYILEIARDTLSKTPEILPMLKQANVVDSGGYGFVLVLSGMLDALNNKPVIAIDLSGGNGNEMAGADFDSFDTSDIKFTYCTECIVDKSEEFMGEGTAAELNDYICSIGDSAVFVDDESMIKLHIHTDHPGLVIERALEYGSIATMKVENMKNQHSTMAGGAKKEEQKIKVLAPEKPYGFVSVCMGDGIKDTFCDLGADRVIFGGQTMNPSTQDIIDGINMTPAECVFVLPNNKNIYLVATQAAKLVSDKRVEVLSTSSVPQGISAMLSFDPDATVEENLEAMQQAVTGVTSMSTTYAVRDTELEGFHISEGQILGLINGKIFCVADSDEECLNMLSKKMGEPSFVTVFYGESVSAEQSAASVEIIKSEIPEDTEITVINGGQPLYNYIISVE